MDVGQQEEEQDLYKKMLVVQIEPFCFLATHFRNFEYHYKPGVNSFQFMGRIQPNKVLKSSGP